MDNRKKAEEFDPPTRRGRSLFDIPSGVAAGDISISLRCAGEEVTGVSRMEIFYNSSGMATALEFDRIHPRYGGNSRSMLDDAIRHLLSEIKFRIKTGVKFGIFYNSFFDQDIVESVVLEMAKEDESLSGLAERLFEIGKQRKEEIRKI